MHGNARQVIDAIKAKQDKKKALWLENYVKHNIKSFGVGIPEIREILRQEKIAQFYKSSIKTQIEFLDDLMKQEYTEPKLAAILFVQLFWKTENVHDVLKVSTDWFDNDWITDWNVCDWLCVRLLTPSLDKEPELSVSVLSNWNKSPNLWKSRASLVPFAQSKNIANHREIILQFSSELIRRQERFCKTSVGWVLREYSKVDAKFVTDFLKKFSDWTTKEVINNATKYIRKKRTFPEPKKEF